MLSRIAGETSVERFLDVAGLHIPAREIKAYDLLKLGQSFERHSRGGDLQPTQDEGHCKLHGLDTMSRRHWTIVQVPANREACALGWIAKVQGVHGPAAVGQTKLKIPANTGSWKSIVGRELP